MKKLTSIILAILLVCSFALFAMGSSESETETSSQGSGSAEAADTKEEDLGQYSVVIDSCRLAVDYEGKDVVIIKYIFTNVSSEESTAFLYAFDDVVYQNGIGLNEAYILDETANYSADNQTKEIKAGASLDVEVAYELNDTTTDIEVEVQELFSFNNKTITKTFTIA